MTTRPPTIDPEARRNANEGLIHIETKGRVKQHTVERLESHLESVMSNVGERVVAVDALLSVEPNHAPGTEARARATLHLRRTTLRAEVRAATIEAAVEELADRLKRQLEQKSRRPKNDPRGRPTMDGSWRHGNQATDREQFFPRPKEDREVVARKTFATPDTTLDEARWDRFLLDYDFYLFVDADTGNDTVVAIDDFGEEIVVPIDDARTATISDAMDLLDQTANRFVFFRDADSGRGRVIYRRYDGHYGLLAPEDSALGG